MPESSQELEAREKKELVSKEEKTVPARYFVPSTDIQETEDALIVVMEVPTVEKKDIAVDLEMAFSASTRIDTGKYEGLQPLYTQNGPAADQRRARGRRVDIDTQEDARSGTQANRDRLRSLS